MNRLSSKIVNCKVNGVRQVDHMYCAPMGSGSLEAVLQHAPHYNHEVHQRESRAAAKVSQIHHD